MESRNVHSLDRIFRPARIALVAATINPNSLGGKVLGNLVGATTTTDHYPMVALFDRRGLVLTTNDADGAVDAVKKLA